jgi:hypothetical protein
MCSDYTVGRLPLLMSCYDVQLLCSLQASGCCMRNLTLRVCTVFCRQAATIVHTRVARVGAISLLGAGLSNLARAGILELAAFLVRAVWAKALSALAGTASTIESSVKKMVTDVEEAVMVPVAAAASVADTVAAVVVEAVVFSFVWACRVLQCLMALVEVHTGISRGATAKCTLRVLVSGVAAL